MANVVNAYLSRSLAVSNCEVQEIPTSSQKACSGLGLAIVEQDVCGPHFSMWACSGPIPLSQPSSHSSLPIHILWFYIQFLQCSKGPTSRLDLTNLCRKFACLGLGGKIEKEGIKPQYNQLIIDNFNY